MLKTNELLDIMFEEVKEKKINAFEKMLKTHKKIQDDDINFQNKVSKLLKLQDKYPGKVINYLDIETLFRMEESDLNIQINYYES